MGTSQIITLLSGAGIGAILSAILVFINTSKKNKLDFITKERSEWRREIKSIIVDLLSENNRHSAISRLETQLNPYGRYSPKEDEYEFYMSDGHIWELVDNFDCSCENVKLLTKYLELLLKYDWERSKSEVDFSYGSILYKIFNIAITLILLLMFCLMKESWFGSKFIAIFSFVFPFLLFILPISLANPIIMKKVKSAKINNRIFEKEFYFMILVSPFVFLMVHIVNLGEKILSGTLLFTNYKVAIVLIIIYMVWLFTFLVRSDDISFGTSEVKYMEAIREER